MPLLTHHEHEDRPWGSFDRYTLNEPSTVKLIRVNPGEEFSLQHHEHRSEFWHVISGNGTATVGADQHEVKAGDEIEIAAHVEHRMLAGSGGILLLEIAIGDFNEDDIVRVEDDYGRTGTAPAGP